ncbi:hypothetical protein ABZ761_20020 [Kitasatospora sp. NPDC006786]|uniref:hypothetical protein n=1 Tax=Kitasatospora sp. NPDC006786 TaxID=3157187 RepID=UPI003404EED8
MRHRPDPAVLALQPLDDGRAVGQRGHDGAAVRGRRRFPEESGELVAGCDRQGEDCR